MFEQIEMAPPDPILGLTEAFKADQRSEKINLSVGVYKDAQGNTPVLDSVKQAEKRILDSEQTKSYKPMTGDPAYGKRVQDLLFGEGHPIIANERGVTAHSPGGTGALRVAGDFIHKLFPKATLHLTDPTWANHKGVFTAAAVPLGSFGYFDQSANALNFDATIEALEQLPAGDLVLLHGCCHNPTGADPDEQQWQRLAEVLRSRRLIPLIDFAYQGFADGLCKDAKGLRTVAAVCPEMIICSSFSKNFGLYNERVGALTIVAADAEATRRVASQLKLCIRTNYSNPPAHGAAIVCQVLSDEQLRCHWSEEVKQMRQRINGMRQLFADKLKAAGGPDWSYLVGQRGMFSFTPITKAQVDQLREEYAIYIVGSGRINVAGITEANVQRLCECLVKVLG